MTARVVLGLALLAALALLARIAVGGEIALVGGALVLALGVADERVRRRGLLSSFLGVLPPVFAAAVAVATLLQLTFAPEPPPGLAWFARVLCLTSAALLFSTRPAGLVLHGLTVVLALWTASALHEEVDVLTGVGTLAAIALAVHGLTLARNGELRSAADRSVSIGVAPAPWGLRRSRWPALAVVLLSLVPLALGYDLPRLFGRRAASSAGSAGTDGGGAGVSVRRPSVRRVRFAPTLSLDAGRGGIERPNERVALVDARPAPSVLYLRGAALSRATKAGFVPGAQSSPPLTVPTRELALTVDLLTPEHGYLFVAGRVLRISGVPSRLTASGYQVVGEPSYPLTYSVTCAVTDGSVGLRDLVPLDAPELLALPASVRGDAELLALAARLGQDPDPSRRASAVMSYLSTSAQYDGAQVVLGADLAGAVRTFLFETQRGICVEFASAAAVLLRLVGVPTRVVTGYRSHEREEGRFVVRARHAHAWIEVAYDGAGWVTYDPTPAEGVAGQVAEAAPDEEAVAVATAGGSAPLGGRWLGLFLATVALAALAGRALGARRLGERVRLATLARHGVPFTDLLEDRARLFGILEARGFELGGPQTPREWLAEWPVEGPLRDAIADYTCLRFSGHPSPERSAAFRRSLDALG